MISSLLKALLETVLMVLSAGLLGTLFGLPLGVALFGSRPGRFLESPRLHRVLATSVNIGRSVPFIILLVAIIPFTRLIIGSSIGTLAAIVPLSVSATPFVARLVEGALLEVPEDVIEAARILGATRWHIIRLVLLPAALPGLLNAATITLVTLVGYSAMAGVVGGGGLGDLGIRYGYQRFDATVMLSVVLVLLVVVQLIQTIGDRLVRRARSRF